MAFTTTVLAWGLLDYEVAFSRAGTHIVVMVKIQTQNVRFSTKDVVSGCKEIADL